MADEMTMDRYLDAFKDLCSNYLGIYYNSQTLFNNHPEYFSEEMRNVVTESLAVKIFAQWENFLQQIFIEYMLGRKSENGSLAKRYVFPNDAEHAYNMIKNVNSFPEWADVEKVLINANNFFEDYGPFKILKTTKSEINALRKIRNAIAHTSMKSVEDFEKIVRGNVGYLPDGITPAIYLIEYKSGKRKKDPNWFEYYIDHLKNVAEILVHYEAYEEE